MTSKKTCIIVGAGGRGKDAYAPYIQQSGVMEIVGVAELDDERRNEFRDTYHLPEEMCFKSYQELFAKGRLADAVIICTQDRLHREPAQMAMRCGYHILLEKPISPKEEEVLELEKDVLAYDKVFITGYVLRYTPFIQKIMSLIQEGAIGDILTMQFNENEGFWHHAHGYVRGEWSKEADSSTFLVAKACHDFDLMSYILNAKCVSISSYGANTHFTAANAPGDDVPDRCTDGCPYADTCKYNAVTLYSEGRASYFLHIFGCENNKEAIREALKTNRYGRCVYRCDNDVCDHQVASMLFENGATAVFTVSAFSLENNRTMKIMGTEGEIGGCLDTGELLLKRFSDMSETSFKIQNDGTKHAGGDSGLINRFVKLMEHPHENEHNIFDSHKMVFAAEKSRVSHQIISL